MFELNLKQLDNTTFNMRNVAICNLFSAWYMLKKLKTTLPNVDTTLARIYFSEYGMNVQENSDKSVAELAKEYYNSIVKFFFNCQIQRLLDIIDRFGKVGCDPRLPHEMTLPVQCKDFFQEIINLNYDTTTYSLQTKETQCLDSLLNTLIVNTTEDVISNHNGEARVSLNKDYVISPEEFSSYTEIVRNVIQNLCKPMKDLDDSHEDWGTKFKRAIDYVKTLVFMNTRDVAFSETSKYFYNGNAGTKALPLFGAPLMEFGIDDDLYKAAESTIDYCYAGRLKDRIKYTVAAYSGLKMEHAICLVHNTNANIDVSRFKQCLNSDTFKFLCCQEFIAAIDEKIKKEMIVKMPQPIENVDPRG